MRGLLCLGLALCLSGCAMLDLIEPPPVTPGPPTATFPPARLATLTPTPAIPCATADPALEADFAILADGTEGVRLEELVASFLSLGGTGQAVQTEFDSIEWPGEAPRMTSADLTGDGQDELLLTFGDLTVIGCQQGVYAPLLTVAQGDASPEIISLNDLNLDGRLELVTTVPAPGVTRARIYGWDGGAFRSLVVRLAADGTGVDYAEATAGFRLSDVDGNGSLELLADIGDPGPFADPACWAPARTLTDVYAWDGSAYTFLREDLAPPAYRFQAAHDGDRLSREGRYEEARDRYLQVIFNEALDWWSAERRSYLMVSQWGLSQEGVVTDPPPSPDPDERPHLTAYAYYRLLILNARHGHPDEALADLDAIRQNAVGDASWAVAAQLGDLFWQVFQGTREIGVACGRVVDLVGQNPEIEDELFRYVGAFHGCQVEYQPVDSCPFP